MELNRALLEHLTAGGGSTVDELHRLRSRLAFTGALRPNRQTQVPLLAVPLILDEADHNLLRRTSETLTTLLPDLPTLLFGDFDSGLRALGVPDPLLPFLRADIPLTVSLSRCDFLRGPDGWRISEINTGAGMGQLLVDDYNACVREQPSLAGFLRRHRLGAGSPMDSLARAAFERVADLPVVDGPTVAVVDWQGYGDEYLLEHRRIADGYRAHGFTAVVCHQRELRYERGRLWFGQQPVDVVHRFFLIEDLPEDPASAMPVLTAALDGAVVLASSFRDEWLANKASFAMMHEAAVRGLLEPQVADLVARMVPRTWLLTKDPDGWSRFAVRPEQVRSHRAEELVLKPIIGSLSAGVVLGARVPAESFWEAVDGAVSDVPTHVVQEFVAPDPIPFAWLDDDGLALSPAQPHPGVFVIDHRYEGVSTRMLRGTQPERCSTHYGASVGGVFVPGDDA